MPSALSSPQGLMQWLPSHPRCEAGLLGELCREGFRDLGRKSAGPRMTVALGSHLLSLPRSTIFLVDSLQENVPCQWTFLLLELQVMRKTEVGFV